jgi:hypothetical protein
MEVLEWEELRNGNGGNGMGIGSQINVLATVAPLDNLNSKIRFDYLFKNLIY